MVNKVSNDKRSYPYMYVCVYMCTYEIKPLPHHSSVNQ